MPYDIHLTELGHACNFVPKKTGFDQLRNILVGHIQCGQIESAAPGGTLFENEPFTQ